MEQEISHIKMQIHSTDTKSEEYVDVSIISVDGMHMLKASKDVLIPLSDYKLQSFGYGETEILMKIKCIPSVLKFTANIRK